jgi:hypothetical protein
MTKTGALVWKEWRDHRTVVAVFAALEPLVSWPVQRWVFKFAEPEWTWKWIVPLCVGLAVAVVAADLFAMDFATSRMASFAALPVPTRRHFTARTTFVAFVAVALGAWTVAANAAIVGAWGAEGAVGRLLLAFDPALTGLAACAAAVGGVLLFSAVGVGGFRAVIGGVLLAALACAATSVALAVLLPQLQTNLWPRDADLVVFAVAGVVLLVAAWTGFVGGRATMSRARGVLCASAVLVGVFAVPGTALALKTYRGAFLSPGDPTLYVQSCVASPDGRYVAVHACKQDALFGPAARSWIVRVEDGHVFSWPRRTEAVYGWTDDGLAWAGGSGSHGYGRFARPESGERVGEANLETLQAHAATGFRCEPRWAQWMRTEYVPNAKPTKVGAAWAFEWRIWAKDTALERRITARQMPAALPTVGQVLVATAECKLAIVDLAGGEPRIVYDDAVALGAWTIGSPDGRWFVVVTSKGSVILDSTDWKPVAGPFAERSVRWCTGDPGRAVAIVGGPKGLCEVSGLVDVVRGHEVDVSHLHYDGGQVAALADGGFVIGRGSQAVLRLGADGALIRRLFPPEE